jgi:multidrug efflux pump subunit AcrB
VVQVVTTSPGLSARSVEQTVTKRIARWVNQAPGAERVESRSMAGASVVTVYFRAGVDPDAALTTTNALALSALPTLPPNTLPPVVLPRHDADPRNLSDTLKQLTAPDAPADRPRD